MLFSCSAAPVVANAPESSDGADTTPGIVEPTESRPMTEPSTALAFDHEHAAWTAILQSHVVGNDFAYGKLKADSEEFYAYIDVLHSVSPEEVAGWTEDQQFAFWINAYNAHTIQKVIENYPLKSIRKLDTGFGLNSIFDKSWIPMQAFHPKKKDKKLSLNDIEHGILRADFKDARLHAAINCASESCQPLLNEAFVASKLDDQLQTQMRAFVNDPDRNVIDLANDRLRLSEIFKWFKEDFERDAGSVREYLIRFASPETADFLREKKIRYLDYSWKLNDAPERS